MISLPELQLTFDGNYSGIFGGACDSSETTVKLVGVSLQNCSTPGWEFGNPTPKMNGTYVIRADYLGTQRNTTGGPEPYVTVNPQQTFSGITVTGPNGDLIADTLTGDGVAFDGSESSVANRILADSAYSKVPDAKAFFSGSNAAALSTYFISGDNDNSSENPGPGNFPVLVLASNDSTVVTQLIASYISPLTNHPAYTISDGKLTPSLANDIFTIRQPVTYHWSGSGFVPVTDESGKDSLTYRNGTFYVSRNCYDNQKDQFTLIDVEYVDPAGKTGAVYHLYIPVIVKKVLEFRFWAAAQLGTNYWPSAYDALSTSVIGSHGEKVTVLMGFEYDRTPDEWEKAINDRENLLWNFNKQVQLANLSSSNLPNGTHLVLVDRNHGDKPFFAAVGEDGSPLSGGVLTFSDFPGWDRADSPLCDGLELTSEKTDTGLVMMDSNDGAATVRAKLGTEIKYFRPSTEEDDPAVDRYTIQVGIDENLCEQYYLTIQPPAKSDFVYVTFQCNSKLAIYEDSPGLATSRQKNTDASGILHDYTRNENENLLILADFFKQECSVVSDGAPLISFGNGTITATLTSTLEFQEGKLEEFKKWFTTGLTMYQSFEVYLIEQNGRSRTRNFVNETTLAYDYRDGPKDSIGLTASDRSCRIYADPLSVSHFEDTITQTATITLNYSNQGIVDQFPMDPDSSGSIGILICANSDWAYSRTALEYSGLHTSAQDTPPTLYHRDQTSSVTLTYNAYQGLGGSQGTGLSQLGINGLESNSFSIATAGLYDPSTLKDAESARYLRCTLTLHPKVSQGNYGNAVTLGNYLTKALISAKVTNTNGQLVNATVLGSDATSQDIHSSGSIVFSLGDSFDHSIPIQLPIDLTVITGAAFEGQSFTYANYRVKLIVELLNGNQEVIAYSTADDYIIYTNAKVLLGMVTPET